MTRLITAVLILVIACAALSEDIKAVDRLESFIAGVEGKRLTYKRLTA